MNNEKDIYSEIEPQVVPDSIEVLGALGDDDHLQEADIIFKDTSGKSWFMTIESADHYASELIESAESINRHIPNDLNNTDTFIHNVHEKNFVWNDDIKINSIHKIVGHLLVNQLEPFIVEFNPDEE